jgi:hypothetical protein
MSIKLNQITLANIKHFIQGEYRKLEDEFFNSLDEYIKEQVVFRKALVQLKKPECIAKGECIKCGCAIPDLFYADKSCDMLCYPKMMSKESWESFKIMNYDAILSAGFLDNEDKFACATKEISKEILYLSILNQLENGDSK